MWRKNYSHISLFRWGFVISLGAILFLGALGFSFYVNRHLPSWAQTYCQLIDQQLGVKISFDSAIYRFPGHLILKHVKVLSPGEQTPLLAASRIDIRLVLPLSSSGPTLRSVVSHNITIDLDSIKKYTKQHPGSIDAVIKSFPKENLRLLLSNKLFEIDLNLGGNHVAAKGLWRGLDDDFRYELSGQVGTQGINVDKMTIENKDTSLDLWGRWQDNRIDWKGFILSNAFYILDIDGHLNINDHTIDLRGLTFFVNGDKVTLRGTCSREKLFSCQADLGLDLHNKHPFDLQSAHAEFKNMDGRLINGHLLYLTTNHMEISWVDEAKHTLWVESLLSSIDWQAPVAMIALSSKIYKGHAQGHFFIDTSTLPWMVNGEGQIEAIDINSLNSIYAPFKQGQGLLSARFDLISLKDRKLKAWVNVHGGQFDDPHFLPWLSQTLQMPGLEPLSHIDLSCHLDLDGPAKMLRAIKLHTDDVDLNGFFNVDADDFVTSQMAVRFSKGLLSTAPIGRTLLGLVKEAWDFPFEFRLSGDVHKMNFQWETSPLKDKVRAHILSFVQRAIDRRLDAAPYPYN